MLATKTGENEMQRIIVFLGLVLVGGSLAVGTGWPAGHGPTIPRPDLAASSSPAPSPSPSATQQSEPRGYLPTPAPTPMPSATPLPSASPSPSATPSDTPAPSASPDPSASPKPCGGCGGAGGVRKPGIACPMFCVEKSD